MDINFDGSALSGAAGAIAGAAIGGAALGPAVRAIGGSVSMATDTVIRPTVPTARPLMDLVADGDKQQGFAAERSLRVDERCSYGGPSPSGRAVFFGGRELGRREWRNFFWGGRKKA